MSRRSAFTLIELLVVAAVMAGLFSLIVVGGRPNPAGHVKQAAQGLAASIMQAQTRALESDLGAGFVLEAVAGNIGGIVVDVNPRPALIGSGSISIQSPTTAILDLPSISNDANDALLDAFRIQFRQVQIPARGSVFFKLKQGTQVILRDDAGQTPDNTIWPFPATSMEFLAPRYPSRGLVRFTLPAPTAVDLRFSGQGDDPFSPRLGSFRGLDTVGVTFDKTGCVDGLIRNVYSTDASRDHFEPHADIYFLVAPRELIETQQTLASEKCLWVVLKPSTGRVTVAANVPQTVDESSFNPPPAAVAARDTLRQSLWNARGSARAGVNVK